MFAPDVQNLAPRLQVEKHATLRFDHACLAKFRHKNASIHPSMLIHVDNQRPTKINNSLILVLLHPPVPTTLAVALTIVLVALDDV